MLVSRVSRFVAPTVAALFAAVVPHAAHAQQTVFDNGTPNVANASGYFSDPGQGTFDADTFTFNNTATFNTIVWYGGYAGTTPLTSPDNFTISLYNTTGGTPNATAMQTFTIGNTATRTSLGGNLQGNSVYRYSSALTQSVTLSAGTYGLGIVNDTTADTNHDWLWATSSGSGTFYFRSSPTSNYSSFSGELAFQLVQVNGTGAPEPGSRALVGMGAVPLVGILVRRRKTIKQAV